nr:MAG TPA: hypothetical protein [Caudoviricetes sp.]
MWRVTRVVFAGLRVSERLVRFQSRERCAPRVGAWIQ